jgi:MFS family permease
MPGEMTRGVETAAAEAVPPAMSQRDVAMAMIAMSMSMFVAMLSNTVTLTAMPKIVAGLHGTQADYTWIVTSSLLTLTICVPIWGRLSDLLNRKLLIDFGGHRACQGARKMDRLSQCCAVGGDTGRAFAGWVDQR